VHAAHGIAQRDLGRSLDHDPMFGAMEVLLQRELAAGLHDDALHLVSLEAMRAAFWNIDCVAPDGGTEIPSLREGLRFLLPSCKVPALGSPRC
jgi:hypothetical protein